MFSAPDAVTPAPFIVLLAGLLQRGVPEIFAAPAARPAGGYRIRGIKPSLRQGNRIIDLLLHLSNAVALSIWINSLKKTCFFAIF